MIVNGSVAQTTSRNSIVTTRLLLDMVKSVDEYFNVTGCGEALTALQSRRTVVKRKKISPIVEVVVFCARKTNLEECVRDGGYESGNLQREECLVKLDRYINRHLEPF